MRKFALPALAGIALAASAVPAASQSYDWSGPYVSVFGGVVEPDDGDDEAVVFDRDFDGQFDDAVLTTTGAIAFAPGSCPGSPNGVSAGAGCDSDAGGVQGGASIGYDWQFGNLVVGVVGDYSASSVSDDVTSFSSTPASYSFSRRLGSMGAARVRVGYAFGPTLAYATGGYAGAEVANAFYTSNGVNSFTEVKKNDDADGFQAGGGLEHQLAPNFSVFGEYLYTMLDAGEYVVRTGPGSAGPTNPFILPPNTPGTDMIRISDEFNFHTFRIGMKVSF